MFSPPLNRQTMLVCRLIVYILNHNSPSLLTIGSPLQTIYQLKHTGMRASNIYCNYSGVLNSYLLCKVLCHNICVVIQSMYELGIEPSF
jgi:hypothetical protein